MSVLRSILALTLSAVAAGAAEFDPWFGDGMVLQRDRPIVVRGLARPGAAVLVRLGDVAVGVDADASGRWLARLPARPAATRPVELEAKDGVADAKLTNILIGDVWLAAGQSNMEFPLRREAHVAAFSGLRSPLTSTAFDHVAPSSSDVTNLRRLPLGSAGPTGRPPNSLPPAGKVWKNRKTRPLLASCTRQGLLQLSAPCS